MFSVFYLLLDIFILRSEPRMGHTACDYAVQAFTVFRDLFVPQNLGKFSLGNALYFRCKQFQKWFQSKWVSYAAFSAALPRRTYI